MKNEEIDLSLLVCEEIPFAKLWMIYFTKRKRVGPGITNVPNDKKTMRMIVCKCVVYIYMRV
jgi:hypothetical protein